MYQLKIMVKIDVSPGNNVSIETNDQQEFTRRQIIKVILQKSKYTFYYC